MFEGTGILVWALVALIVVVIVGKHATELFRRWFVKPEYPCEKCHSRFTLLSGKNYGISTGTFYRTRCLACGHTSGFDFSYYSGKGRNCGSEKGWAPKSLQSVIDEDRRVKAAVNQHRRSS